MPITARGSIGCRARRLTNRNSVSLLTEHQAFGKTGGGTAAQSQPKMMDNIFQTFGAPGQRRKNAIGKSFRDHLSPTQNRVAAKAPDHYPQVHTAPGKRQIGRPSQISAVDPPRDNTARWACAVDLP